MKAQVICLLLALAAAGCASTPATPPKAEAQLKPTLGSSVAGTVTFTEEGKQVRVRAAVIGLSPGLHGFHIHDKGDCSAPDATSAGAHFNPSNSPHGGPESSEHHGGDLGNLTADAEGKATLDVLVSDLTVKPGATSVVGRGLIVHSDPDDLKTQPTGNSGKRVACAVITAS